MKVIGFANKFYTLWEVTEESRDLGNGHHYLITHFNYIKNISFDKETAMKAYPDADFDEGLRGKTSSWESKKEIWDNVDTFRFGKYSGQKIAENNDTNYIAWYWDNICDEHKEYVGEILKSRGYEIRTNTYTHKDYYTGKESECTHTWLMSPEEIEYERVENEKINQMIKTLDNKEPFEICTAYNPDCDGEIMINNIIYHFQEVKENYYQGFTYYLPVLNGKAKRIKNKTIIVDDYTFDANDNNHRINIYIKNFSIKK